MRPLIDETKLNKEYKKATISDIENRLNDYEWIRRTYGNIGLCDCLKHTLLKEYK